MFRDRIWALVKLENFLPPEQKSGLLYCSKSHPNPKANPAEHGLFQGQMNLLRTGRMIVSSQKKGCLPPEALPSWATSTKGRVPRGNTQVRITWGLSFDRLTLRAGPQGAWWLGRTRWIRRASPSPYSAWQDYVCCKSRVFVAFFKSNAFN